VVHLYPRTLGSLYVASYDSQGYGESILTLPQPGGLGYRIYTPHEQSLPVLPPGTGLTLRDLYRL
jgi:hypothetical protein